MFWNAWRGIQIVRIQADTYPLPQCGQDSLQEFGASRYIVGKMPHGRDAGDYISVRSA